MTPKIIELKQAPVVLVESQKGLMVEEVRSLEAMYNCRWLGILSDLTEDQLAECVVRPSPSIRSDKTEFYRTPKDSFYSLLESESVYTENPLGTEPTPENTPNYAYSIHARQWEQAQSRTIDPERTVVLLKKK